jgi:lysozyme
MGALNRLLGLDISLWQDDNSTAQMMDFVKAKQAGANFVFIKASERGGVDPDFVMNWKNAKTAGLPRGAYHFLRWDLSGLMQARIFCSLLKDDLGELPPVADFEAPAKNSINPSNAILAQFLEVVESETGKVPMIYTSPGFWNSWGKNKVGVFDAKWAYYPLWIAHYTSAENPILPEPWKSAGKMWTFWQYGVKEVGLQFGAESKLLDVDWFNGDEFDLLRLTGAGVVDTDDDDEIIDQAINQRILSLQVDMLSIKNWARGIGYKG